MPKTREELEELSRLSTQELSRLCEHCGQPEGTHSHDDFCPLPDDAPRRYSDISTFEPAAVGRRRFIQIATFPKSDDCCALLVALDANGEVWRSELTEEPASWKRWETKGGGQ